MSPSAHNLPVAPAQAVAILRGLAAAGALTSSQADRLVMEWGEFDEDTFHQPWFRTIHEYTRIHVAGLHAEPSREVVS